MTNNFNKQDFITKVKPHGDKLIAYMQKNGVEFSEEKENVVFTSKEKQVKISNHSFYGFSRMGAVRKDVGESQFEFVPVTHEMFIGGVMKSILETHFGLGKSSKK
jgi:hypothetical protein